MNRREALSGTLAAILAGEPLARVLAVESSRGFYANDQLQIGLIGVGGRCRHLARSFPSLPNVRITAVCDVWDAALEAGRKLADARAFATRQHEELLARADVDAVLICTPDHWHVPQTIAACQAGKDVYVEKPLTHAPEEGPAVIAAQNKYRRVVQVGTQHRSMPHLIEARQLLREGIIGTVHTIHCSWNRNAPRAQRHKDQLDPRTIDWKRFLGNAPDQPFDPYKFRQWRWFWDFGGGLFTDLMVHWVDTVNWFLDLAEPAQAVSIGDYFSAKGVWETPDTVQTLLRYPERQIQLHFEGTFSSNRLGAMCEFRGTEATLYVDRGRYEIIPDRGKQKPEAKTVILGAGPKGLDFYDKPDGELLHLTNWIACIRDRSRSVACPAEAGVLAAAAAHKANRALPMFPTRSR
ncbi:MAG: Gfo/Idh/MocA family oxidoreductase [Thermogemmata sp.]|nr:Gfo/Idh/MocA family oxidoreductase [Thermogemmata sp.]